MKRLFVLIALFPALSWAQNHKWNLDDCMLYATQNNFKAMSSDIKYRNSKISYNNAILRHLPSLSSSINAGSSFGRGIDPETNTYINTTTFSSSIGANINIPIFNSLDVTNNRRQKKIAMLRNDEEQRQVRDQIALDCMLAYIEVVYNQRLVELTIEKLEQNQLTLKQTQKMESLGTKNAADVAQIEADLASEELSLLSRQNALQLCMVKLKDIMNFPIDSTLEVNHEVPFVNVIDAHKDLNQVYEQALAFIPSAAISKFQLESSRISLQSAKWSFVPGIGLGAGIGTSYFTNLTIKSDNPIAYGEQLKNNIGESVSASISIPIFNALNKHSALRIAKNDYQQAKNNLTEAQRQIKSEIEKAMLECQNAEKQLTQAEKSLTANVLAHKANQRKYEEGVINILEYQLSANNLLSARIESVYARLRYIALCRQVNFYKGVPYIQGVE